MANPLSPQAGQLRHRVTLQAPATPSNPFQPGTATPTNVATLWARIRPLTSAEVFQATQVSMKVSHRITIRYPGAGITLKPDYLVLFGSRVFKLAEGYVNAEERNITVDLLAYEIDPTG
jgi:SPP1 family predicted phage head-tail adaptor